MCINSDATTFFYVTPWLKSGMDSPRHYCPDHSPRVVYRPASVLHDDRTGRQRLDYKPFCATERYWRGETERCSQYHTGTRRGQCECTTAGCMVDSYTSDCVPYDPEKNMSSTTCEVNRGTMALCASHMPGRRSHSGDWRENCIREPGYRCRIDGKDIACVPNHDPNGRLDVPPHL